MEELDGLLEELEGLDVLDSLKGSKGSEDSQAIPTPAPAQTPTEQIIRERTAEIMSYNEDKRFSPNGNAHYDVKKLRDHQQEILRLLSTGLQPKTISEMLGCTKQTVSNLRESELGQAMLSILHSERNITIAKTAERVDALAPKAAEIFEEIMTDPDVDRSLQYRVARDTLKANGILIERHQTVPNGGYLSGEEVHNLKNRFQKAFGQKMEEASFVDVVEEKEEKGEEGGKNGNS